jgi:transketolase
MALRAIPHLHVYRPADANETIAGWKFAMQRSHGPTGLVTTRQDVPVLTKPGAPGAERGGYVLAEGNDVILIGTGSEVHTAMEARDLLAKDGISARVVSLPCWELFAEQDAAYRESVLPHARWQRVSVEAGVTFGWREHVGERGVSVGIDRFGASAPGEVALDKLGINAPHVASAAKQVLGR